MLSIRQRSRRMARQMTQHPALTVEADSNGGSAFPLAQGSLSVVILRRCQHNRCTHAVQLAYLFCHGGTGMQPLRLNARGVCTIRHNRSTHISVPETARGDLRSSPRRHLGKTPKTASMSDPPPAEEEAQQAEEAPVEEPAPAPAEGAEEEERDEEEAEPEAEPEPEEEELPVLLIP